MKKYMVQGMVLLRSAIKPDNHAWKNYASNLFAKKLDQKPDNHTWKNYERILDMIGYFYGGLCGAL